jgi:hypothetical protein
MENASLNRGFIGSFCNLQKYSIAWVSVIGNLPNPFTGFYINK